MLSIVANIKLFFNNKTDESKILVIYRLISLSITSFFYLLNYPEHEIVRKIIIIMCLFISSIILSYLYPTYEKSINSIKLLLIIETISYTLILIPSGGINSPFIWYSLNTILICFIFLKIRYVWIIFIVYLTLYGIISKYFTNTNIIVQSIRDESNLFLSFIMIIFAIQLLVISIKRTKEKSKVIEETNEKLEKSNMMLIKSIDHIKELYQSVNILTNQGNKEGIIKLSFDHIKKVTKANIVFYFDITNDSKNFITFDNNNILKLIERHILKEIDNILKSNDPIELYLSDTKFLIMHVGNGYSTYGLLGVDISKNKENIVYENSVNQLQFLSELLSNAFERLTLEEVYERLLITEEQNRIANEIHDSVLQRLFSLSCGMFSTIKNLNNYKISDVEDDLNQFRKTIDLTMKDLRDKIYGLSWKKSGNSSFNIDIKRYIDDIKKFNKVSIPFSINGNLEILSTEQKKALYRMICEGIGNAVRHGKAKNIEIKLDISAERTLLSMVDDGLGFEVNEVINNSTNGLGLQNLRQLAEILHGEISIDSMLNNGTKLKIMFPNILLKGDAVI